MARFDGNLLDMLESKPLLLLSVSDFHVQWSFSSEDRLDLLIKSEV